MNSFVEKVAMEVKETTDDFIFRTISPFCDSVLEREISKDDLKRAISYYFTNVYRWNNADFEKPFDSRPVLVEAEYEDHDTTVKTVGSYIHDEDDWDLDYDSVFGGIRKKVLKWRYLD